MKRAIKLITVIILISPLWSLAQGFTTNNTNGNLIDANGNNFIIKGLNVPLSWYQTDVLASIPYLKTNTGANCLRIVINAGYNGTTATPASVWQACVQACIDNKIIPIIELHDWTGGTNSPSDFNTMATWYVNNATYLKQASIAKYILIDICNEWGTWNISNTQGTLWRDGFNAAVKTIRAAGINTTLIIDAVGYGQDIRNAENIRTYAKSMISADPKQNLLFAIHMYCIWAKGGDNIATIGTIKSSGIPILIGEFGYQESNGSGGYCDIDEDLIISTCESNGIGWLAWSQKGNNAQEAFLDLCTDWNCTNPTTWGTRVFSGTNGTKTAVVCTVFNTNPIPTVTITNPANNSSVCSGTAISITATATVSAGAIGKVDFYDGTTILGTVTAPPYTYNLNNPSVGTHTLGAIATSAAGAISTKNTATITVNAVPAIPTVTTPVNYAYGATASALTAIGTSVNWFTTVTGGTASTVAPTPVTNTSGTFNYYVSQMVNTCESPRATITVIVGSQPISLKIGWNVIGCPISGTTDLQSALSSIWTNVSTVKNLDSFYSSSNLPAMNSLTTVQWGQGYFVYVTAPCTLDWIAR